MKPTNAMAQLEQWKKNNQQRKINQFVNEMNRTKNLASDSSVSANGVHPNELKNELVKNCESKLRNAEAICESGKTIKSAVKKLGMKAVMSMTLATQAGKPIGGLLNAQLWQMVIRAICV
ncbi:conserved hypothetical protein [Haemophilus influenzae HK1212]|uniref:Uncharacterized protein n=1 Tax=Haemophilus influenzae HK1212 TaxID=456482 RepID=A0A7G2K0L7_HAEIF|nr:conserved hypothetical protein [Haemophilus influenzae HK1212]